MSLIVERSKPRLLALLLLFLKESGYVRPRVTIINAKGPAWLRSSLSMPDTQPQKPSAEEARRQIEEAIARARNPSSKEFRDVESRKGQFSNVHVVLYHG